MDNTNRHVITVLSELYRIIEAGEQGYAVAAANVKNRGLKVLFRSYAQQRVKFKEEIKSEIWRLSSLGGRFEPGENMLGAIHRGRITIFATMTIGDENREKVVLKEVNFGEGFALRAYERALKADLPQPTRELVQRQYDEVKQTVDTVQMMRGKNGNRQIVRLFDSERDADRALQKLKESGYSSESIERKSIGRIELYMGGGIKVYETVLSGAVGGAVWGTVSAILAAIGVIQIPKFGVGMLTEYSLQVILAAVIAGLIVGGIFVGGGIGFFMGLGDRDEDRYLYRDGIEHGKVLVQVLTDESRASRAWELLAQVNREARTHTPLPANR